MQQVVDFIGNEIDEGIIPGAALLVTQNGEPVFEHYTGTWCSRTKRDNPVGRDTRHLFYSYSKGVSATVRLDQLPGQPLEGQVTYVYPEADPMTRAVRIRLAFENPKEVLKPNSFATVTVAEPDPEPVLNIPLEALIRTSEQTRVIVETAPNRFVPRSVRIAYESGGMAAVSGGLSAGERVVTSGQFMLDSEASLRGELERISAGEGPDQGEADGVDPHAGHRH